MRDELRDQIGEAICATRDTDISQYPRIPEWMAEEGDAVLKVLKIVMQKEGLKLVARPTGIHSYRSAVHVWDAAPLAPWEEPDA